MKKLSLLIGTLGGAMAGYLFSNKKLRDDLSKAKDAETAAKLLGKHLQHDGMKLAEQAQDFIGSTEVQQNWKKAKEYAQESFVTARKELLKLVSKAEDAAMDATKDARGAVKASAFRAVKNAKKAAHRMQTKVRRLV